MPTYPHLTCELPIDAEEAQRLGMVLSHSHRAEICSDKPRLHQAAANPRSAPPAAPARPDPVAAPEVSR